MKKSEIHKLVFVALLGFGALTLLPACSTSDESEGSSGSVDCSEKYTNEADIKECEIRGF